MALLNSLEHRKGIKRGDEQGDCKGCIERKEVGKKKTSYTT